MKKYLQCLMGKLNVQIHKEVISDEAFQKAKSFCALLCHIGLNNGIYCA
ncbi:MAG: hypothetical protein Q8N71_01430 [candidate division Zixibacteria bacterium]|nr:hypothetical protein [candidate division Zixibacteria bacterium]